MSCRCSLNCIVPPHILQKLMESPDPAVREIALNTLLGSTRLRTERRMLAEFGFVPSTAGTKRRSIFDCRTRRVLEEATLVRGETDAPTADATVNQAFDGLGETYDFYKAVFDRNSVDDRGMRLDGYVNFGRSFNNAFWNGRQMVFGNGDGRLFTDFTRSLDVVAHELAHGVTEFTANLAYHNQSGALNESMSDVFGSLVKQWHLGQTAEDADWLIGTDIFTPMVNGDAMRSLKAPGEAYNDPIIGRDPQPRHMDEFAVMPDTEEGDNGGVHINSGIPNHAFFLVATAIGGNAWEAPGQIWYESLRASSEDTEFQEFADRTYDTAGHLFGTNSLEQRAVLAAWKAVGLRISRVPFAEARRRPVAAAAMGRQNGEDQVAALGAKLDKLTEQVQLLAKDVAAIKPGAYPERRVKAGAGVGNA
jgi:Zn-dependent metalloprotease